MKLQNQALSAVVNHIHSEIQKKYEASLTKTEEKEVKELSQAFDPARPFLFILGGAKFETKVPLIKKYIRQADTVFIGGALANDFLKGKGYVVGESLLSDIDMRDNPLLEKKGTVAHLQQHSHTQKKMVKKVITISTTVE